MPPVPPSEDSTVSPAINVAGLSDNRGILRTTIRGLPWKKGFTNMAQAFILAETMFTQEGRADASPAVLTITDGKASFNFQTNQAVQQLEDKGIQRFFLLVNEEGFDASRTTETADVAGTETADAEEKKEENYVDAIKNWASQPWVTNFIHVPGIDMLMADQGMWREKVITTFCPLSVSPSETQMNAVRKGYMLIKRKGVCGERGQVLADDLSKPAAISGCSSLAATHGAKGFYVGQWFKRGWCYSSDNDVDQSLWDEWMANPADPECPTPSCVAGTTECENDAQGWTPSKLYDYYAMKPLEETATGANALGPLQ